MDLKLILSQNMIQNHIGANTLDTEARFDKFGDQNKIAVGTRDQVL